jgi:hypothetical protein
MVPNVEVLHRSGDEQWAWLRKTTQQHTQDKHEEAEI